jgi:hypothetical protein
MNTRNRT